MIAANRVPLGEVVDSLVFKQKDLQATMKASYLSEAKLLWKLMNLRTIKDSKRVIIDVDKGINSIKLPDDCYQFSSIYVYSNGRFVPLLINSNLSEDLVDLSEKKSCSCGCGSDLCANVRNYELIQSNESVGMPDGSQQVFVKTSRKSVAKDGSYFYEITEPIQIFDSAGVHIATELKTRVEEICKLDVDENGCVKDCEENKKKIYGVCGFNTIGDDCGKPVLWSDCICPDLTYNVSDDGDRIILPSNLAYDKVVVRYFFDSKTSDIMIPIVAVQLFQMLLYAEFIKFDNKIPQYRRKEVASQIIILQSDLGTDLSRMTMANMYQAISRKKVIGSNN